MRTITLISAVAILLAGLPRPCCCANPVPAQVTAEPSCPNCPSKGPARAPVRQRQVPCDDCPSQGCPCKVEPARCGKVEIASPGRAAEFARAVAVFPAASAMAVEPSDGRCQPERPLARSGPPIHIRNCQLLC